MESTTLKLITRQKMGPILVMKCWIKQACPTKYLLVFYLSKKRHKARELSIFMMEIMTWNQIALF